MYFLSVCVGGCLPTRPDVLEASPCWQHQKHKFTEVSQECHRIYKGSAIFTLCNYIYICLCVRVTGWYVAQTICVYFKRFFRTYWTRRCWEKRFNKQSFCHIILWKIPFYILLDVFWLNRKLNLILGCDFILIIFDPGPQNCSSGQKYMVWVIIIDFSFMLKIYRYLVNFLP